MGMLRVCGHPGCGTLTLGELCIEHELSPAQRLDRRRLRAAAALATRSRSHRPGREANGRRTGV
jgi:hypothetical protein